MRWRSVTFWLLLALLLVPAVALTVLRFTQPGMGVAVRAVGFTPYALPLYFLAFLLLLVPLVRRTGLRLVVAALSLVSVAGVVTHIGLLAPEFAGDAAEPGEESQEFRVMTANLYRGEADPAQVVGIAAEQRVATLVLQEVTPEALVELEEYGLADYYPYRAGEPAEGVEGTMVFSRYRLRTLEQLDTGFGSWSVEAIMQEGPLRILAVHARPPIDSADRWADDLEAIVDAADADSEVDIIVGDLNATPDHWALHDLADLDFHSAAERSNSGWQPTWPDHWLQTFLGIPLPRLVQIDHILVGRTMAATATNSVEVDGTDHRAVIAEVAFR